MRLIFLNRYYWPDESATSVMLTDLASALAAQGHEVIIMTSRQQIENPDAQLQRREIHAGVQIRRLYSTRFGRRTLPGRAIDYISFYVSALRALVLTLRRSDIMIAKTDPPLISVVATLAAGIKGSRLVNWLQDVYPEVAVRLGVFPPASPLTKLLMWLRDLSLRLADANVAVGERMRTYLEQSVRGCAPVTVIHNWSQEPPAGSAVPSEDNPYRRQLGLQDKVVFCYSGNLGRAHQFDSFVDAAAQLRDDPQVHFLIIGSGAQAESVRNEIAERGLRNWSFLPPQPREKLPDSLGAADVHLVSLNPAMEGLIVPSKLYGILAAGRPALFLGSSQGEVAGILREQGCGLSAAADNPEEIKLAVQQMAKDRTGRQQMGAQALKACASRFSQAISIAQWSELLRRLAV